MNRRKAFVLAGVAMFAAGATGAFGAPSAPASRYASIVLDADTGAVLYERNADLPRFPASLTKIMTLYLAFEAIAANKLSLADELTMSAHAVGRDPSRLDLAPGSKLKVEEAIRAMTTKSANDAACGVAEHLGKGSESRFADAMTAKAKALGLTQTKFRNASGLPDDGQVSSARDLALLCKALIQNFPEQYRYFSMGTFDYRGTRYPNQNRFLRTYYGADGIKTGFVNASGHNLAASAVRGGKRLIAVVLGGDTQGWTREHTMRLLDVSYAKVDPSLVMVASNSPTPAATTATARDAAPAAAASPAAVSTAAVPAAAAPVAATVAPAPAATYATPAGAVTISSAPAPALPLPNATANLAAYAAAASAPVVPSGSVPAPAEHRAPIPVSDPATVEAIRATDAAATRNAARKPAPQPVTVPATAAPSASATASAPPAQAPVTAPAAPPAPASPAAKAEPTADAGAGDGQTVVTNEHGGDWSVQVGLYRDATVARRRGEEARQRMPLPLRGADLVVGRALDGVHVTSRISRLSEQDARTACNELQRGRVPCVVVPPGRPMVVATN